MSYLTDQYQNKELDYFTMSKTRKKQIIDLIGEVKDQKILDLGCGAGELGEYFKNSGNYVVGVEVSSVALEAARKRLNEVLVIDLEAEVLPESLVNQKFNIIIAAEIIEHLLYPEKLLTKLKSLLTPTGFLIITTPNFLVWSNRLKMLFGKFAYQTGGFWCRDHIHFFTLPELRKTLIDNHWQIIAENHLRHPKIPKFFAKIYPSLFAFQLILKAKPNDQENF